VHFVALSEHGGLLRGDSSLHDHIRVAVLGHVRQWCHEVQFEANEYFYDVLRRVGAQVLQPKVHRVEGVLLSQVKADEGSTDLIVIDTRDLAVALLPSRVPDVHLYLLRWLEAARVRISLSQLDRLDFEVPGEGRLRPVLLEDIVYISLDQASLADCSFADTDHFVVPLLSRGASLGVDAAASPR